MADGQESRQDDRADVDLVSAFREGDDGAAAELYRRHYLRLVRGVATRLPSFEIAEDCVGTAFLRVLEIIRRGKGPTSNVYGYLRTAVVKESANFYLASAPLVTLEDLDDVDDPLAPTVEDQADVDVPCVQSALETLPEHWRQLVKLRYVENKKPAEIAKLLDTDVSALRKMLYRAKNGLRDAYMKQFVVNRSVGSCLPYSSDLAEYANGQLKASRVANLEAHLAGCTDCRHNLAEVQHQWARLSPEALGLALLLGGFGGGSILAFGGASEATAVALKTAAATPKLFAAGGLVQTLGTAGSIAIAAVTMATIAIGTWAAVSTITSGERADPEPTTVSQQPGSDGAKDTTISTKDGDCELVVSVNDGELQAKATVHEGDCWLTYQRVGAPPRAEAKVKTGWLVVTRVPGEYKFNFRSDTDSTSYAVTL